MALREMLCAHNGLWICGDQGVKVMIKHTLHSPSLFLSRSCLPVMLLCLSIYSSIREDSKNVHVYSSSYFVNRLLIPFMKDFEHIRHA